MPPSHTPPETVPPNPQDQPIEPTSSEEKSGPQQEPSASAVLAEAAAIYPDPSPDAPTAAEIAAEAYAIFLNHGARHGRNVEHWLEAERLLRAKRVAAHAAGSSQPASPTPQESTRGQEEDNDRQRAIGAGAAAIRAEQEEPVARSQEPSQGPSEARRTSLPESRGQHAGSGQVQRRHDPQAPSTSSKADIGPEAERQKGRVNEKRGEQERT